MYERWGPDWHIITAGWLKDRKPSITLTPKDGKKKYRLLDKDDTVLLDRASQQDIEEYIDVHHGIKMKVRAMLYARQGIYLAKRFKIQLLIEEN